MDAVMLYATWPDLESAESTACRLVERRQAACVNLLPGAVSIYRWEGEVARQGEVVMLVKTSLDRATLARATILEAHPYELPCVTAFRIDAALANADFMRWLAAETSAAAV